MDSRYRIQSLYFRMSCCIWGLHSEMYQRDHFEKKWYARSYLSIIWTTENTQWLVPFVVERLRNSIPDSRHGHAAVATWSSISCDICGGHSTTCYDEKNSLNVLAHFMECWRLHYRPSTRIFIPGISLTSLLFTKVELSSEPKNVSKDAMNFCRPKPATRTVMTCPSASRAYPKCISELHMKILFSGPEILLPITYAAPTVLSVISKRQGGTPMQSYDVYSRGCV